MPATKRSKSGRGVVGLLWLVCFCITLSSRESRAPEPQHTSSQKESNAQSLTTGTSLDQQNFAARQAMTRADDLRASWTEASLREAIELYDKASLTSISVSDFANASQANLKCGDVFFLLNEYPEALKRYQEAETLADRTSDWLTKASAMARTARLQSLLGKNDLAQQNVSKALDLFKGHQADRSSNATNAYGETFTCQAEVTYATGNFLKAHEQFKHALDFFQNDPAGEARAHLFSGYIDGSIGDPQNAIAEFSEALKLYRQANDKSGEGQALTVLGLSYSFVRDYNRDLDLQRRALEIFLTIGDRHSQVLVLNALGQRYEALGAYSLAFDYYQQALRVLEAIESVDGMTVTVCRLATVQRLNNKPNEAFDLYERCLQLSHDSKKERSAANALEEMAKLNGELKRYDLAMEQYAKVMKFYESIGDPHGNAIALNGYGEVLLKSAQPEAALNAFRKAQSLSNKVGNKEIQISTLHNLARANLALESHETALSLIQEALKIVEDERAKVASPEFRASYFAGERKLYEVGIEILMQLGRLRPGQDFVAQAFLMSEKSRARLLFDLLSESRMTPNQLIANKLIDSERQLRARFQQQLQYKSNPSLTEDERAAIESQMARLRADYQEVQAQIRQQHPHLFSTEHFAEVSLQQIQNELRDGTMLLEFALGEQRSYLWVLTSNSLQAYELPPREQIEDAARELYRLTTARQRSTTETENYQAAVKKADNAYFDTATRLSQMLLGPVAEHLENRRLLVVAEGALQYISLDALPVPHGKTDGSESGSGKFLIDQNEIVVLPSMSTLIALRKANHRAPASDKLVAIIADPVLGSNDDRVQSNAVTRGVALAASEQKSDHSLSSKAASQMRDGTLPRLTFASEEADAISSVAPWGTTLVAKGFDATRETAMGPDIGQYQILHFATHGLLDSERPEFSAVVLSSVDRNGQTVSGLMALYDIYSLDLSAEVTVLSACQTALGKDIKGEGLVGLTHGFMSAGSKSVVASLWKVDDRATAFLMAEFYDSMFQKGMSPSAALRSAKLKVRKDKRWREPYFWAGFVLQGEYTNRIVVARHSWLPFLLVPLGLLILLAAVLLLIRKRKRRFALPRLPNTELDE